MHHYRSISIDTDDDVAGFGGKAGGVVLQPAGVFRALGLTTAVIGEEIPSRQVRPAGSKLGGSCEG